MRADEIEALKAIYRELEYRPATLSEAGTIATDAQDSIAALIKQAEAEEVCACGGREPIYDGGAEVFDVRGNDIARADAGSIRIEGEGLKEGDLLEVLIFKPVTRRKVSPG